MRVDASSKADIVKVIKDKKIDIVMNACDPRFNPQIFAAAYECKINYMDMAMHLSEPHQSNPYEEVGIKLGDAQFEVADDWENSGIFFFCARDWCS